MTKITKIQNQEYIQRELAECDNIRDVAELVNSQHDEEMATQIAAHYAYKYTNWTTKGLWGPAPHLDFLLEFNGKFNYREALDMALTWKGIW